MPAFAAIIPAITGALGAGGAAAGAGGAAAGAGGAAAGAGGAAAGGAGASGMMGNLAKQFGPQILGNLMGGGGGGGGGDQQGGGGGGMPNPLDMATGMANNTLDTIASVANQGFNAMLDRNV